jgi:hypothetical protein
VRKVRIFQFREAPHQALAQAQRRCSRVAHATAVAPPAECVGRRPSGEGR